MKTQNKATANQDHYLPAAPTSQAHHANNAFRLYARACGRAKSTISAPPMENAISQDKDAAFRVHSQYAVDEVSRPDRTNKRPDQSTKRRKKNRQKDCHSFFQSLALVFNHDCGNFARVLPPVEPWHKASRFSTGSRTKNRPSQVS